MTNEEIIIIDFCEMKRQLEPENEDIYNAIIKALEQEPISETDIILTREEYGELVSNEYDNGYAKGYREALEQEPILDEIKAEMDVARYVDKDTKLCKNANASGLEVAMQIIDKYIQEG